MKGRSRERGVVLIATMMLVALMLAVLGAYHTITNVETGGVRYSKGSSNGFYSAEAGLNLRADEIRSIFVGYNRPSGVSPSLTNPCTGGNLGSGDYACRKFTFNNRDVWTYIIEDSGNPKILTIPPGERYQNLNAQEYDYTAKAETTNRVGAKEALLELQFKTRLVPLFQFAIFYNKDLEILPGPNMTLQGPVYTNGDLYLYSNNGTLAIHGQTMAAGSIYRGRKDGTVTPSCNNQHVDISDGADLRTLIPNCSSRYLVKPSDIKPWGAMLQMHVQQVTVPGPGIFNPAPGAVYWDRADLRLVMVMDVNDNFSVIQVRNADHSVDASATTKLNSAATCPGGLTGGKTVAYGQFWDLRENRLNKLLDVDVKKLFDCLKNTSWLGSGKALSDTTDGGIVIHLTVSGPNSGAGSNGYGARLRNAQTLQSTSGSPAVRGLTVVSDQAIFLMGHYNSTNKIPAAVMCDTIHELSPAWSDANCGNTAAKCADMADRRASAMTVNAAFLAGTSITGGQEGPGGQGGVYNGGNENMPRFHEDWSSISNVYRGSMVSLSTPNHSAGAWGTGSVYSPPTRDWNYDTSFNNAANLPPLTPRFVYLRQELFLRDYTQ